MLVLAVLLDCVSDSECMTFKGRQHGWAPRAMPANGVIRQLTIWDLTNRCNSARSNHWTRMHPLVVVFQVVISRSVNCLFWPYCRNSNITQRTGPAMGVHDWLLCRFSRSDSARCATSRGLSICNRGFWHPLSWFHKLVGNYTTKSAILTRSIVGQFQWFLRGKIKELQTGFGLCSTTVTRITPILCALPDFAQFIIAAQKQFIVLGSTNQTDNFSRSLRIQAVDHFIFRVKDQSRTIGGFRIGSFVHVSSPWLVFGHGFQIIFPASSKKLIIRYACKNARGWRWDRSLPGLDSACANTWYKQLPPPGLGTLRAPGGRHGWAFLGAGDNFAPLSDFSASFRLMPWVGTLSSMSSSDGTGGNSSSSEWVGTCAS